MFLRVLPLAVFVAFVAPAQAQQMSAARAQQLEQTIGSAPDDVSARNDLIRYYFPLRDPASVQKHAKHVLWMIEHHPEHSVLATPLGLIDPKLDPEDQAAAARLWDAALKRPVGNPSVLLGAANFFRPTDLPTAQKILSEAFAKYPDNQTVAMMTGASEAIAVLGGSAVDRNGMITKFDEALANSDEAARARHQLDTTSNANELAGAAISFSTQRMALMMHQKSQEADAAFDLAEKYAKRSVEIAPSQPAYIGLRNLYQMKAAGIQDPRQRLVWLEKANRVPATELERSYLLPLLAEAHFEAGELEEAATEANELLRAGAANPKDWNYGNAIHHGNIILGRIALKGGDVSLAAERLLEAGRTSGSPQLNSFGPDWKLAQELVKAGQTKPVLVYLELVRNFWRMDNGALETWAGVIRSGGTPNFLVRPSISQPSKLAGRDAPDFRLRDLAGKQVALSDYRGKVVLIDFWATWCAPCREELPALDKIHREGKAVVLAVDVGEDEQMVQEFVRKESLRLPVLLADAHDPSDKYQVRGFPTLAIVDRKGKVVDEIVGGQPKDQLEAAIERGAAGAGMPVPEIQPCATADDCLRDATRLARARQYPEAIAAYSSALKLRGNWFPALSGRAHANFELKRFPDAIQDLNVLIRLRPNEAPWYDRRGLAYSESGDHEKALPDYARAMELAPDVASPYNNRGWAYLSLGRLDESLEDLNRALELNPSFQLALENRINLYVKRKEFEKAAADCDAVLRLNPSAVWAERRKSEILKLSH